MSMWPEYNSLIKCKHCNKLFISDESDFTVFSKACNCTVYSYNECNNLTTIHRYMDSYSVIYGIDDGIAKYCRFFIYKQNQNISSYTIDINNSMIHKVPILEDDDRLIRFFDMYCLLR